MQPPPQHQWEHLFVKNCCSAPWHRTSPLVQRRTPGIWSPILEAAPEAGDHPMINRIFGWEPPLTVGGSHAKIHQKKIQKMPAGPKKETFPKPAGQGNRKLPQRLGFHVCNLTTFGEGNAHHQRSTGRSSGFHHDHRVTPLTKLDAKSQISCRRITTWKSQWKRKTQKRWSIYNASKD